MAGSYLKRYLLCAALNIVVSGEDDDARGLVARITPEQVGVINDLIDKCKERKVKFDMAKFLDWVRAMTKALIEDLSDIPSSHFDRIVADLTRKANSQ